MAKRWLVVLLVFTLLLGLVGCGGSSETVKELTVGFVPSSDAAKINDKVEPMRVFLEKELGIPVKMFVSTNYIGLVEAMGSKQADVGFLNPLGYVLANSENGSRVVLKSVRNGQVTYSAQFIVRADSGIKSVADLKGKKIAFTDAASTSGYLYPVNYLMTKYDVKDINTFFAKTQFLIQHDAVVKAVYNGDFDAGVTFDDARTRLEKEFKDVMQKVTVLEKIPGIPNDTVSVRKDLSTDQTQKVKDALLKFAGTEEGKKVLKDLYQIDGFADAAHEDYKPIADVVKAVKMNLREAMAPSKK